MFETFNGKTALVTGGSSGIGRATALALAREGVRVAVAAAHNVTGGEETVRSIRAAGGEAMFIQADVADAKQIERLIAGVVEAYGSLDYAFNNAGLRGVQSPFEDYPEAAYDELHAVDLKGFWLCMRAELKQMNRQGGGVIVNTGSTTGLRGARQASPYVAFKHGLIGMTKSAALEYAERNIRVNCVCPGQVETPMNHEADCPPEAVAYVPMKRFARPEEIAPAVLFLFSDGASYITGQCLVADGGQTIGII